MKRLVVVSNRVADPREARAGGLATAMKAALDEIGGIWFGWSGAISEDCPGQVRSEKVGRTEYATLDLCGRDHENYYNGFANRTLWPLLHYRLDLVDYRRDHYDGYLSVNRLFAERLARLIAPDDVIWVHDYHLIPLALLLRGYGIGNRIGFFLHTPLPSGDLLSSLPRHRELFEAFSAYDLVGFQTQANLRAFVDYCTHEMGGCAGPDGGIVGASGRHFRAGAFPIGIDVAAIERAAGNAHRHGSVQRLKASLQERRLVIGVDRLDYSKGIPERFQAFGQFLTDRPDRHGKVTLLQIAPTSRDEVAEYRQIRSQLNRLAGSVNGANADPDWVPIRYVNKSYQQSTLAGYYRLADAGLVTPLRDGMNLVAKEYVAAQDPHDPGVLVLSRFAGAAHELKEALLVNPYDIQDIADSLERALAMPLSERSERWQSMMATLRANDIAAWRERFLERLVA